MKMLAMMMMMTTATLACEAGWHQEANFGAILWLSSRDPPFAFGFGCDDNDGDDDEIYNHTIVIFIFDKSCGGSTGTQGNDDDDDDEDDEQLTPLRIVTWLRANIWSVSLFGQCHDDDEDDDMDDDDVHHCF